MSHRAVPTLDDLQGMWRIVKVGQDGGKAPFFVPWLIKLRLEVNRKQYRKFAGNDLVETGRLNVKPEAEFSILDEKIVGGEEDGQIHRGIVRWVGRRLEHLQGKVGDERPASFPYTKDSKAGYAMLKRIRQR